MKKWLHYAERLYGNKKYVLWLVLIAAGSYGFMITHGTVGIDDTPYDYYFQEGLAAIVGRWVLFLLNKAVAVAEFAPFLTDLAGVLLLMAAVTVWSTLFFSILGDEKQGGCMPWYGYLFFAGIFLSCPLISEVYTYHLHNGIAIGYLCSGISLCCFREGLICMEGGKKLPAVRTFLLSAAGLWIAMGCYESFMIVWLVGLFLLLLTERLAGIRRGIFGALCIGAGVAVLGLLLRSVMIAAVTELFGLEYLKDEALQRSVAELAGWLFEPGAISEFAMVLKRVFVMYGVFAYAYLPIAVFVLAAFVILLYCVWQSARKKDVWPVLLAAAALVSAFLLVVIEGKATLYRSAQFLPLICGYGAMLAIYAVCSLTKSCRKKDGSSKLTMDLVWLRRLSVLVLAVIVWNQCADMNRWFYLDYRKYQSAVETAAQIAFELEKNYDTSKPVAFTGVYEVPESIVGAAYVKYNSDVYYKMKRLTDMVDGELLDKFNRSYGVWVAQTPSLSVIEWGRSAFGSDAELVRFFGMHGHELIPLTDEEKYKEAEEYSLTLPKYPAEGAIVDMGEYIIVHF